ncbi:hypothetical protein Vretifemale_5606 [Volvox reticuliferus]|nr:hypothetical protein Vretifemale_5606 [Volvox reticuliferus]
MPPSVGGDRPADEAQWHGGILLAAALLEQVLAGSGGKGGKRGGSDVDGGGGRGQGIAVLAEHPEASARVMVALAALIGNPRLLLPLGAATYGSVPASQPTREHLQSSHAEGRPQEEIGTEPTDGSSTAAATGSRGVSGGAAQLQLEALHLLLLMLRTCQEPTAAAAVRELVRLDEQVAWLAAVRRGLGWLLRSRAPGTLKHLALQLAAVVVDTMGDGWLRGSRAAAPAAPISSTADSSVPSPTPPLLQQQPMAQEEPGSFLLLLFETLKIETGLLLQDALHPDRPVPAINSLRSSTLGHAATPTPSQRLLDELATRAAQRKAADDADARAAAGAAGPGPTPSPPTLPPPASAATEATTDMEVDGDFVTVEPPSELPKGGEGLVSSAAATTMPASQRALLLLPACFRLLEGSVEAVAADAAAADGCMEVEISEPTSSARPSPPPLAEPVLSNAVLQKLMSAFSAIIETLLQFFETANAQQQNQQLAAATAATGADTAPSAATGAAPSAVLLGAARVLGRYLAEAPDAVHSKPVLQALPFVMALRSGGQEDGVFGENDNLGSFALTFLLPGLLQATGPGADRRSETTRSLRTSPTALGACVVYLAHCVRGAVVVTPLAERLLKEAEGGGTGSSSTGSRGAGNVGPSSSAAALDALVRFERGMADVSMFLLNMLEPSGLISFPAASVREATEGHRGDTTAAAITAAEAWEVLKHCCTLRGCHADAATSITAAADAVAADASRHLPPLLAQLLPVCWLMEQWAWSRRDALKGLSCLDPFSVSPRRHATSDIASSSAVDVLFRWQLGTRTLLCTSCLATVILVSSLVSLAGAAAARGHGYAEQQKPQQDPQRKDADAHTDVMKVAACLLPKSIVEHVAAAALAAAAAGTSLQLVAQLPRPLPPPPGLVHTLLPMTPTGLADDFQGDGELSWERLLAACVQLLEVSPPVRCLVVSASGGGAPWLQGLAAAHARREPAAEELLLTEGNLALLVQVVMGTSTTGV